MIPAQEAVDMLNTLLAIDAEAVSRLATNYVGCSKALGRDTQAVIGVDKRGAFTVGMIGIMNAMVTDGYIAAVVTNDGESVTKFVVLKSSFENDNHSQ
ncbi:hypothetical protein AAH211_01980 [Serratia fonticola]|uniref:hypothetical protein n=1 Tax=Serratia fonticola TaxID=47917 RepID=UPI0039859331